MSIPRIFFVLLLLSFSPAGHAAVSAGDFPVDTIWYLHADLEQMRSSDPSRVVYSWLQDEIFEEVYEESGIDLDKELDSFTAFSDNTVGTVIVLQGPISKDTQDKILALAAAESDLRMDLRSHGDKDYYHFGDEEHVAQHGHEAFEDLEESAYFSFAVPNKAIITSNEDQMQALLANGGRITGSESHSGTLFVLTADQSLVQAGLDTESLAEDDDDWESNIIRHTEQAALLVAEHDEMIAVEARLVSTEPKMAESIGSIINGLISLQAFNEDLDPELVRFLQNTKVEIDSNVLSINTVIAPELVRMVLDE